MAAGDPQLAAFFAGASAVDACQGALAALNDAPAWFPLGATAVTFWATDICDNSASGSSSVTVEDTLAPTVTDCPEDDTLVLDAATCTAEASYEALGDDLCAGPVAASHTFAFDAPGDASHTYVLADGAGNAVECAQTVTAIDTTAPVVTCPDDDVLPLDPETCEASATYTATALDACDGAFAESHTFTFDAPLSESWTYSFTDGSGNTSACTQSVIAEDTTPPVFTAAPVQELWPPNHKYVTVTLADCGSVVDACDGAVDLDGGAATIAYVTSDEPEDANGNGDGRTRDDMVIADGHTVELRAEREGTGNGRVYTIHFVVSDDAGNEAAAACRVDVPHDQGPHGGAVDDGPVWQVP